MSRMRFCAGGSRVGVRAPSPVFVSVEERFFLRGTSFRYLRSFTCGHENLAECEIVKV